MHSTVNGNHADASGLKELGLSVAIEAEELDLLASKITEDAVRAGASSLEQRAPAVVAGIPLRVTRLARLKLAGRLLKLRLQLVYPRLHVRLLQLQILVLSLKCRLLRLDEIDVLAKHRRRAVLGDELVKKFENACHAALLDVVKVKTKKHTPEKGRTVPLDTPEQLGLRVAHWVAGEEPIYRPGPSAACLIAASNNTLRCLRIAHSAALVLIFLAIALISCSSARRAGVFMLIAAPMCSVAMSIAEHRTITRQPTSKPAPTNSQGDAA